MFFKSKKNNIFFISEIGSNHEGNFKLAKKMMLSAIDSGTDAVKFQIFDPDTLVNKKIDPKRHKHFNRLKLGINEFIKLAKICIKKDVLFMASVWSEELLKKINPYIKIHKVGSGDMNNYQIIDLLLKTKKPIIISTGLSNYNDIKKLIAFIKKRDSTYISKKKIALLQCTSNYPNNSKEVNLNTIKLFKKFNLPVGYSDHTEDNLACIVAYLHGAEILEKHFTYNKKRKSFRDHQISMEKEDLKNFLQSINKIDFLFGEKKKKITISEKKSKNIKSFKRGIYAKKDIKKGDIFSRENIIVLRPNALLSADKYFLVLGKKSKYNFKKLEPIIIK